MATFDVGTGLTAINTILAEEANRINQDIYNRTLHTSPWLDLMKQSTFPDGMGYQLTTLIYDRAIPTTDSAGNTAGVTWSALGTLNSGANNFTTSDLNQPLKENRYRDEFGKVCDSYVAAVTTGTAIQSGFEGDAINTTLDLSDAGSLVTPTANISNAILDKVYFNMIRKGCGSEAYGRENGRPVFGLVCSSEASYQLFTESGFRDDVRYNNGKVSELIAPLGIEKSFRGFYHLIDDLAPRFTLAGDVLTRVMPYTVSSGITSQAAAYETAAYEAAFVIHPHVCESQIPNPFSGASGISFNPVNYRGDFKWTNIPNEVTNPDGTIGFFRGVLASAIKPITTDFGYMVIFKRTENTPGA